MPLAKLLAGAYNLAMIATRRHSRIQPRNSYRHTQAFREHLLALLESETGQTSAALGEQMHHAVRTKVLAGNNVGRTLISLRTNEALRDMEREGAVFRSEGRWWVVEGV